MRLKTIPQTPHKLFVKINIPMKHFYYSKLVPLVNIFVIFVPFNQTNKHKVKYIITARIP